MNNLKKLPKIIHHCMTIGELPTSYKISLTYEEQLLWFCHFLENEVIPVVNNNSEVVEELKHYLENLDVQDEINKKLEEMAEDGTLTEIIAQYIELQSLLMYNTVEDMKEAENLVNGSFAKTYGFYEYNDGGGAFYKIRTVTNTDIINEINLFALHDNTLVAELVINNVINVKQLGAKGDNETNDSPILQFAVNNYADKEIIIPEGTFIIDEPIDITNSNVHIHGNGYQKTILKKNSETVTEITRTHDDTVFNFGERPSVFNLIFPDNNQISNIEIYDLSIVCSSLEDTKNKIAINTPYITFSRFKNIRITNCYCAINYGGWINNFENIDMLDCYPNTVSVVNHNHGSLATTFTKCHSNMGSYLLRKCTNFDLNNCSADNGTPCFDIRNSPSVNLNSCSTETNFQCVRADNSYVVINGGDYEGHSALDVSRFQGFIDGRNNAKIMINNPFIHFAIYEGHNEPNSKNIFLCNASLIKGNAEISTPYVNTNYIAGSNAIININDEIRSRNNATLNKQKLKFVAGNKVEIARFDYTYGKNYQFMIKGYGQKTHTSILFDALITATSTTSSGVVANSDIDYMTNAVISSKDTTGITVNIIAEHDTANNQIVLYYTSNAGYSIDIYAELQYNVNY